MFRLIIAHNEAIFNMLYVRIESNPEEVPDLNGDIYFRLHAVWYSETMNTLSGMTTIFSTHGHFTGDFAKYQSIQIQYDA